MEKTQVPKTDIFEAVDIPDMCAYQNKCIEAKSAGCFLSLIKRKKITRLDEKHLILMAEKRGLFGETNPKKERARIQSRSAKKEEHVSVQPVKIKRKRSEEIALLVGIRFLTSFGVWEKLFHCLFGFSLDRPFVAAHTLVADTIRQ